MSTGRESDAIPITPAGQAEVSLTATDLVLIALDTKQPVSKLLPF